MLNLVRIRDKVRLRLIALHAWTLRSVWGMEIGKGCKISLKANLDRSNPSGIHIGDYTGIAFGAVVLAHDFLKNEHVDTYIGSYCHISANVIVYPGVRIGDSCIVSAGSVVTRDLPDGSLVAGNPARVVEKDVKTGKWGIRVDAIPSERLDPRVVLTEDSTS